MRARLLIWQPARPMHVRCDAGTTGRTGAGKARIRDLERRNRELPQANEDLKKGETIFRHYEDFAQAEFDRRYRK